jgi:hypothetical protein
VRSSAVNDSRFRRDTIPDKIYINFNFTGKFDHLFSRTLKFFNWERVPK